MTKDLFDQYFGPKGDYLDRREMKDWTRDSTSGRSNFNNEYNRLVEEVRTLIMSEASALLRGDTDTVARLIISNLAHKHQLAPAAPYLELLQLAHDKMDEMNNSQPAPAGGLAIGLGISCLFCHGWGYDQHGIKHRDDCVLYLIRKELNG